MLTRRERMKIEIDKLVAAQRRSRRLRQVSRGMFRVRDLQTVFLAAFLSRSSLAAAAASRIVAIGDVHGAGSCVRLDSCRRRVDRRGRRWTGGTAILVQTGDLIDRGQEVRAVLDLMMALESQAASAGGRVQPLLGNHEVMNLIWARPAMSHPKCFGSSPTNSSESRREQAYQAASKLSGRHAPRQGGMARGPPDGLRGVPRSAHALGPLRQMAAIETDHRRDRRHGLHARRHQQRFHDRLARQRQQAGSTGAERVRRGLSMACSSTISRCRSTRCRRSCKPPMTS